MSANNHFKRKIKAFSPFRLFPDLKIILLLMILGILSIFVTHQTVYLPRILLTLPMILLIPGYVLIAALFPSKHNIDVTERLVLSFGLSIVIATFTGFILNYTPWGIRQNPIVISLTIFTAVLLITAQYRRFMLPEEDQFFIPFRQMAKKVQTDLFPANQRLLDRFLSIILIIAVLAVVGMAIYVIAQPKEGENFTEFYILGKEGRATDYPNEFFMGEPQKIIIGVGNHEYRMITYRVETYLINQSFLEKTNISTVHSTRLMDRFKLSLNHNETVELPYTFTVNSTDFNRLEFLLFDESVQSNEKKENMPYRDLHLWINVRSLTI